MSDETAKPTFWKRLFGGSGEAAAPADAPGAVAASPAAAEPAPAPAEVAAEPPAPAAPPTEPASPAAAQKQSWWGKLKSGVGWISLNYATRI